MELEPWLSIMEDGQKKTWMPRCPDEVNIINLFGTKPNFFLKQADKFHEFLRLNSLGNGITNRFDLFASKFLQRRTIPKWTLSTSENLIRMDADCSCTYMTGVIREFSLFKYFLDFTQDDYLYMTNTSSYVNLENLREQVKGFPRKNVYGGTRLPFDDFYFCSGSNRIFSRDVVELLVQNFQNIKYCYFNDVAIGELLNQTDLIHVDIPSLTFTTAEEIMSFDKNIIKKTVHFRLKSGNFKQRNDPQLMKVINSII